MATGGLTKGKSHKEGGIPMKVKNTGQNIEVEGGEIIINKKNVSDTKKHTFDGKELTKCEIASEINSANGNGVEIDCDSVEGKKYKYKKGGTIMSSKIKSKVFDENGKRKIDDKSIEELTTYINSLPQTKAKHFNNTTKRYSQKRRELHKEIINSFIGDVVCIQQDEPIAILMGGSPASGKSSFLKKYAPYLLKEDLLRIDADEVRSMLPEYEGWNASQTHLETKDIVETLLSDRTIGIPCEFDLIYDGTMNNTKSYKPLIALLKKLGYKIFAVYIDNVPYEVIKKRALERYQKSGRFVPMEVIDDFFEKGKTALNKIKEQVDGYMIIDGSNRDYEIIEKGGMQLPKTRKYGKLGYPISEHFNTDFPAVVKTESIKYGEFYAKGGLTQSKAKKILEDGVANGKPLTKKQKIYMNLIAKGGMSKFEKGGSVDGLRFTDGYGNETKWKNYEEEEEVVDELRFDGKPYNEKEHKEMVRKFLMNQHRGFIDDIMDWFEITPNNLGDDEYFKTDEEYEKASKKELVDILIDKEGIVRDKQGREMRGQGKHIYEEYIIKDKIDTPNYRVDYYAKGGEVKDNDWYKSSDIIDVGVWFLEENYKKGNIFEAERYNISHKDLLDKLKSGKRDTKTIDQLRDMLFANGQNYSTSLYLKGYYGEDERILGEDIYYSIPDEYAKANAGMLLAGQVLSDPNARKDILEFTRNMQQMRQTYEEGGRITGNDIEKLIPYYQLQALKEGEREIASGKREEPLFLDTLNEAYKLVPKIYAQDGKGMNAVAYFHYFYGGSDWYITELDKKTNEAFGYAIRNGDTQMSELGYISISELTDKSVGNAFNNVNIDQYFNPKTLNQIFQSKYPELVRGEVEIYEDKKEVEVVETSDYLSMEFKNPYERNIVIRGLIDDKGSDPDNYTIDEKEFIGLYSGMGGLEKFGASEGLLFEYYTPKDIVEKMWGLAFKHKLGTMQIRQVLEPSVATGNFVGYAPKDVYITGYDIDKYAWSICNILYSKMEELEDGTFDYRHEFYNSSFEKQFFTRKNTSVGSNVNPIYDLVIGNPPYGNYTGMYAGMGEKKHTGATDFIDYFIYRSLDLLRKGGLLVFIIGKLTQLGGKRWTDQMKTPNKAQKYIKQNSDLVDAYRLPVGIFDTTDVESEIIVLRKK